MNSLKSISPLLSASKTVPHVSTKRFPLCHLVPTVKDIVRKRRRVAVQEELSVDLLEIGFCESSGGAVLEKAFVPRLQFSLVELGRLL